MEKKIRIRSDGTTRGTEITIDAVPLNYVTEVSFRADIKYPHGIASLTICVPDVEIEMLKERVLITFEDKEGISIKGILDGYLDELLAKRRAEYER